MCQLKNSQRTLWYNMNKLSSLLSFFGVKGDFVILNSSVTNIFWLKQTTWETVHGCRCVWKWLSLTTMDFRQIKVHNRSDNYWNWPWKHNSFQQVKDLSPKMSFYNEKKLRSRLKQAAQKMEEEAPRPDCVQIQLLLPTFKELKRDLYHRKSFWWNNKLVEGRIFEIYELCMLNIFTMDLSSTRARL